MNARTSHTLKLFVYSKIYTIVTEQSVLTAVGEQFLADIIQAYRDRDDDYFVHDLCDEWELDHIYGGHIRLPDEYEEYGTITTVDSPLLLKTLFNHPNPKQIRTHPRNAYPRFRNEVFGEICLWKEAQRRRKPHTDLFAPVFDYDTANFEWAIVASATDIRGRAAAETKHVENRGRELGWAPDDTEVGRLNGEYVAIDYGYWWRRNDEWITDVNERPYIDTSTNDDRVETQISDNVVTHELDDTHSTHRGDASTASQEADASESQKTRFHRWLSSLFS